MEEDIRMTQEEEGMEVDVHTPDKALPGIKMKEIVKLTAEKDPSQKQRLGKPPSR